MSASEIGTPSISKWEPAATGRGRGGDDVVSETCNFFTGLSNKPSTSVLAEEENEEEEAERGEVEHVVSSSGLRSCCRGDKQNGAVEEELLVTFRRGPAREVTCEMPISPTPTPDKKQMG